MVRREKIGLPTRKIKGNTTGCMCIYLTHQRHGGIPIVVQRALEVREVIFKTSKVNFMTYVKCQCDGNNPRRWVFGFLGEEINAFLKNPNEILVPKAYVGGLV